MDPIKGQGYFLHSFYSAVYNTFTPTLATQGQDWGKIHAEGKAKV